MLCVLMNIHKKYLKYFKSDTSTLKQEGRISNEGILNLKISITHLLAAGIPHE